MRLKHVAITLSALVFMVAFAQPLAAQERFVKLHNGIVKDTQTGLEWFAADDRDMDWHTAKRWVQRLALAGGGWRMPAVSELAALFQETKVTFFAEMDAVSIWSAHALDESAEEVLVFNVEMGFEAPVPPAVDSFNRAMAVRKRP